MRSTVTNQLLLTPDGLMQLNEVFGLDNWETEPCVACLTDPRDTILLPCRHLWYAFTHATANAAYTHATAQCRRPI